MFWLALRMALNSEILSDVLTALDSITPLIASVEYKASRNTQERDERERETTRWLEIARRLAAISRSKLEVQSVEVEDAIVKGLPTSCVIPNELVHLEFVEHFFERIVSEDLIELLMDHLDFTQMANMLYCVEQLGLL